MICGSVASNLSELSALLLGWLALWRDAAAGRVLFGPLSWWWRWGPIFIEERGSGGRATPLGEGLHEEDALAAGALDIDGVADLDVLSGLNDAVIDLAQLAVAGVSGL